MKDADASLITSLFVSKLNSLNNVKPTATIADLEVSTMNRVNYIRHYTYRTGEDTLHNIQIDLDNHTFLPPLHLSSITHSFGPSNHSAIAEKCRQISV